MLLGVVFCGGKSTRMGCDKGLLQIEGMSWAESAFRKLSRTGIRVVISINHTQKKDYQQIFSEQLLIEDEPMATLPIAGPLAGLLTVHRRFPNTDLLVLACDLPRMQEEVLRYLVAAYRQREVPDACIAFSNEGLLEPMCSIYSHQRLHHVNECIDNQSASDQSLQQILKNGKTIVLPLISKWQPQFRNYNDPSALMQPPH